MSQQKADKQTVREQVKTEGMPNDDSVESCNEEGRDTELKPGEEQRAEDQKAKVPFSRLKPFVGYLLLAITLNYVLEVLSRHSFVKAIKFAVGSPAVFFYNAFIIFVTLSLVLFAKRKIFATVFVSMAWIISAFANWIVLNFRTTPFSAIDVLMIRNVMTMLDKYMTKWQMVLSGIGIALVFVLLIYLYIRLPKSKSKRRPFRASAYVCMCFIMVYSLTKVAVETKTVSDNFGNLAYAYNDYGFAYCFSNSIIDVGINRPKNYSEEAVHEITDRLDYDRSEVILQKDETADSTKFNETDVDAAESGALQSASEENGAEVNLSESSAVQEDADSIEKTIETASSEAELTDNDGADENAESVKEMADKALSESEQTEGDMADAEFDEEGAGTALLATREHPNIIVIQLESIFDTKYMKDFHVSERVMPTYAWLKNRYSSGLFTVPAVGAGTANTEFEVQTGMSTQFFGAGEYPFKTVMRSQTCDSMAYDLKRLGYATAGFHNNDATFYERYIDYSNLGFDVFTAMEHMYFLQYTPRGWAKDNILDNEMIERMKQTEGRDYITTITVQAHGRYPKKHTDTLTNISCYFTGQYEGDTEKEAAWEYYINQCRETDNMLKDLIAGLNELGEPTVVFMYGDHLPSLSLQDSDLRIINLYQTEWAMWDNIGLAKEYRDLKAYQASTYIFDRLGLSGGLMQHFHRTYMNQEDQEDYLNKLEMLEYDTLYGENYAFDQTNPFPQIDMKLGIRDIVVEDVESGRGFVFVHGKGFNTFSQVYVDGKDVETTYMNYQTLLIPLSSIDGAKELYVAQVGDDHIVLSETEVYSLEENSDENMTPDSEKSNVNYDESMTLKSDGQGVNVGESTTSENEGEEISDSEESAMPKLEVDKKN